ncbi:MULTISPECIES: bile acid:sodium symporter family protein [Desulfovibrio]|jgi:BASS family bile acid:Na+ symporter|uniref:bile acid:sodium symporter family protein n=1 Tax=Desulfovibrio TaxID=872 RepID=UPI0019588F18|nr:MULTISPECIES: bile acid:sodium symporter family protein [Desulfovibrio]MBM6834969.1 bile acid:sodium symporter family protein [Desulfovibrio piger]MCI7372740.1 bile acid:sodium symporter family protein [Desulfovibrio piger]MDM8328833.1 bile acid:sodium symporter family protein [Desulfovibrio piger]MDY4940401.1 bile acid:sodium symporter family protein [Desulfovibrio sp.]MDY6235044.1 bile acid:sodium symporter family protein [Desulfovibrio sp.]
MLSVLRRLSVVLTRFMGVIIIAFSALALWQPWIFSWVAPHISAMLGIIMLGMGMTLHWQDFSHVLRHPRDLGLGLVVQFGCMPLLAFALCHVFALPPELAMGMILVGTAPGGTASNVLTFIARGDVAFSVAMTAAATLVSLLLTPPLTWLLGGVWVPVDMGGLFWSIVKIVLVPVLLGLLLHHFQRGLVDRLMPFLPLASALVITLVIAGIIAVNAQNILSAGPAIFAAVIAHNLLGLAVGWFAACRLRFAPPRRRALAIEIGTQNSGLATALALAHFTPAAAIAGALFSVWQNISGALLSNFWATRPVTSDSGEKDS